jgi:hypothetical protein
MILYRNSINAHVLFLLHLIYTFFKAPEAMSTLKFDDETATQLSRCTKIISCSVVFPTKYNSIYFLWTPIQKFPSPTQNSLYKIMVARTITIDEPHTPVKDVRSPTARNDLAQWRNTGKRASNKGIMLHVFSCGCHHTDATA